MTQDVELDRQETEQNEALERMQRAYENLQAADEECNQARLDLFIAKSEEVRTRAAKDLAEEDLHRIKSVNKPKIDKLSELQEAAFEGMREAYDNASAAYRKRERAGARLLADQGDIYKSEAQRYTAERRGLLDDIRHVRARFDATKSTHDRANASFISKKKKLESAELALEIAKEEFELVEANFHERFNNH